jgi:RNA polymerase-binding transcription factor DksA
MSTQHSEEFISEMKSRLVEEKKQLESELSQISHKKEGNFEANYPDYERDEEANAMEAADYEAATATTEAAEARLKEVSHALEAIEAGKYGITDNGEFIPENRLRANPAATTIVKK